MLGRFFNMAFRMAISNSLILLMVLYSMISLSPELSVIALVTLPALMFATTTYSRKVRPMWGEVREQNGVITSVLQENLSGLRDQLFDPDDETVFRFMSEVGSDKLYSQMCRNQKCFRARLTPKPWRIELPHIKPRPGVWPVNEERMAERSEWIDGYDAASRGYAACRYEKTLGSSHKDRDCEWVRQIHDEWCRARQDLPLA